MWHILCVEFKHVMYIDVDDACEVDYEMFCTRSPLYAVHLLDP
jgi:hypothetical protein